LEVAMVEAMKKRRWAGRLTLVAVSLCFGSVAAALIASVGAGQGAWHFGIGFTILRYAFFVAIVGVLLALVALFFAWRGTPRLFLLDLAAIIVAGIFVAFLGRQVVIARAVPPIHDISTNLEDWPRFYRLTVRPDNLDNLPDMGREDLASLEPRERWKAIHREY
jgi:hypothetical protein